LVKHPVFGYAHGIAIVCFMIMLPCLIKMVGIFGWYEKLPSDMQSIPFFMLIYEPKGS